MRICQRVVVGPSENFQRRLQEAFINAEPGQTIELPAGDFAFYTGLSLAVDSVTVFRMNSNDPDVRMPEIGRSIIHDEAVALVRKWLNSLSGGCPAG
jgi:hypothetical protein